MQRKNFTVCASADDLNKQVAEQIVSLARHAIRDHGSFHLALAGGSTPKLLYTTLAREPYTGQIDWSAVHIYFGDERHVPPDHKDSNFAMANQAMLQHVPVPSNQVHRIPCELGPAPEIAGQYAALIESTLPHSTNDWPVLDLVLLGLGPDGHIASLFPDTDILDQRAVAVAAVYVDKLSAWRISMTYPLIENANNIFMLVAGHNKAAIIRDIFRGHAGAAYPAERLNPSGRLRWYLDEAAADDIEHVG